MRLWNTDATTRFYNASGELLIEHRNTVNQEFVGWIGLDPNGSDWVARIVMDTAVTSGTRQVGYSDHLYFGILIPAPGAGAVPVLLGAGLLTRRRRA